jgi:hypothetical protein
MKDEGGMMKNKTNMLVLQFVHALPDISKKIASSDIHFILHPSSFIPSICATV